MHILDQFQFVKKTAAVAYNEEDMTSLLQHIHSKVDAQGNDCENIVTIDDVLNDINRVKSNKCDGCFSPPCRPG